MAKRPGASEWRAEKAAAFQLFAKRHARKAYPGWDSNDWSYDRRIEAEAKRMRPEELDRLLNGSDKVWIAAPDLDCKPGKAPVHDPQRFPPVTSRRASSPT